MISNRARKQLSLDVLIYIVLIQSVGGVLFSPFNLWGQKIKTGNAVDIAFSNGSIVRDGYDYKISIIGSVSNSLPVPVSNVKVQVDFPDTKKSAYTIVTRIDNKSAKLFTIEVKLQEGGKRFISSVADYRLETDNLNLLLNYFWETKGDLSLRKGAVEGLAYLTSHAIPQVIARFKSKIHDSTATGVNKDVIEILLLLPALQRSGRLEAVEALFHKESQLTLGMHELNFSLLKQVAVENDTIIPLLNTAALKGKRLQDLFCDAIASFGHRAMPILVRNEHITFKSLLLSDCVLRKLGLNTREKQMAALLAATGSDKGQRKAVDDTLDALAPSMNGILLGLLDTADSTSCECLIAHIQKQGRRAYPSLFVYLEKSGIKVPPQGNSAELVNKWIALGTYRRLNQINTLNKNAEQILAAVTGKKLTKKIETLFAFQLKSNGARPSKETAQPGTAAWEDDNRHQQFLNTYCKLEAEGKADYQSLDRLLADEAQYVCKNLGEPALLLFGQKAPGYYSRLLLRRIIGGIYMRDLEKNWKKNDWNQIDDSFSQLEPYLPYLGLSAAEMGDIYLAQGRYARSNKIWKTALDSFVKSKEYVHDSDIPGAEIRKTQIMEQGTAMAIMLVMLLAMGAVTWKRQITAIRKY